ncbi:hypothetical protein AKJ44_02365, partial [candidate division MSBL1 archaeon SCGC-AAA261F17]
SSLVIEKLEDALKEWGARLVVVTGLAFIFMHSDIPQREAVKLFEPVAEELENLSKRDQVFFLASGFSSGVEESEILSKLISVADVVLEARDREQSIGVKLEKHPSNPPSKDCSSSPNTWSCSTRRVWWR